MKCFLLIVAAFIAVESRTITQSGFAKNVVKDHLKWPKGNVYYEYSISIRKLFSFEIIIYFQSLSPTAYADKMLISEAMREIASQTCVKFVNGYSPKNHYILITNDADYCGSDVGYLGMSGQILNLGKGCMGKGTIMHEILHSLGFYHQQSSSNRDSFVVINEGNIKDNQKGNFDRFDSDVVTDFELPYDYNSIMHYGPYAFTNNGKETITAIKGGAGNMGQRENLSATDIEKINKLYQCPIVG